MKVKNTNITSLKDLKGLEGLKGLGSSESDHTHEPKRENCQV
jgi:hypothetical protein